MPSSGILRLVTLKGTDVSEERIISVIRVKRIRELGTKLTLFLRSLLLLILIMLFLAYGFLSRDDEGDIFLRNVGS
jgi:hypothetical protein